MAAKIRWLLSPLQLLLSLYKFWACNATLYFALFVRSEILALISKGLVDLHAWTEQYIYEQATKIICNYESHIPYGEDCLTFLSDSLPLKCGFTTCWVRFCARQSAVESPCRCGSCSAYTTNEEKNDQIKRWAQAHHGSHFFCCHIVLGEKSKASLPAFQSV